MEAKQQEEIREKLERMSDAQLCSIHSALFEHGWEPEAIEIAGEILGERGIRHPPARDCPICHGALEKGMVKVHGTTRGFLSFGFSWQHLFFSPFDGDGEEAVLCTQESRPACRCTECGTLLVESSV